LQKRKLKDTFLITFSAIIISLIYPVFADGFKEIIPYVNSFFIGLTGGMMVSFMELEVFDAAKRKYSFLQMFVFKTVIYFLFFLLIIPSIIGFMESVYYKKGFLEHMRSQQFRDFILEEDYVIILFYALFFIALINFTRLISRKLGQGTLLNYISGIYHKPREVQRIFMFLDLRSSTTIAEKLGAITYHKLLREFFEDITECIVLSHGIIYRYVADQVVVCWNYDEGLKNANCIKAYTLIKVRLKKLTEKYLLKYNVVPAFTASFHCGTVVIGEIGDIKSQIVYHGEVLYQLAEIEKKCSELKQPILISESLKEKIVLPSLYKMTKVGEIKATQKEMLKMYTLKEASF